ncbi:hypothetical protein Dimus_033696 [Dionaea muscipula]
MPSADDSISSQHHPAVTTISKCTIFPHHNSTNAAAADMKLSVCDLPMLSCHYIQKGLLFPLPPPLLPIPSLISLLQAGLSATLSHFPPLAGRLKNDSDGYFYLTCNGAGVDFVHATAQHVSVRDVLAPIDVPDFVKEFFPFDRTVSYDGQFKPILAVQVTELADGIFIGCAVNHAVVDGTSYWNFFNAFAEVCRGGSRRISRSPDFRRDSVLISPAVLKFPNGGPNARFSGEGPLRERIFSFSREAIKKLKAKANHVIGADELLRKQIDGVQGGAFQNGYVVVPQKAESTVEISSFQSLCALLWRCATRARNLDSDKTTTFRMAVNCRHRLEPKLDPLYFGNAIQSIPTVALVGDLLSRDLRWSAEMLNKNVRAHDDATVRRCVADWERNPRFFPLGNFDGAMITMGSSNRFPMYENDFGWGKPLAIRSGRANKFDGKMSAFPGRDGGGSVDLEVILTPKTMSGLEKDPEFIEYVSPLNVTQW